MFQSDIFLKFSIIDEIRLIDWLVIRYIILIEISMLSAEPVAICEGYKCLIFTDNLIYIKDESPSYHDASWNWKNMLNK